MQNMVSQIRTQIMYVKPEMVTNSPGWTTDNENGKNQLNSLVIVSGLTVHLHPRFGTFRQP